MNDISSIISEADCPIFSWIKCASKYEQFNYAYYHIMPREAELVPATVDFQIKEQIYKINNE